MARLCLEDKARLKELFDSIKNRVIAELDDAFVKSDQINLDFKTDKAFPFDSPYNVLSKSADTITLTIIKRRG